MNMIQSAKDQVLQLTAAAYEKAAAAGALIRRTNQQKAFELLILAKLGNG